MSNARFTRRARLTRKTEFQNVFAQPTKSVDGYFTVLARPNDLGIPRLGLVVSRKSARTAVARNRIKRVVRESFRRYQPELGSMDIIVIGRDKLARFNNATLFDSLEGHWLRLMKRCGKF